MLAHAWNSGGTAEGDNGLSVPVIRPCGGHAEYTERSKAKDYSKPSKKFHDLSPVGFSPTSSHGGGDSGRPLYGVGFKRDLEPERPAVSQTGGRLFEGKYRALELRLLIILIAMSSRVLGEPRQPPGLYPLRLGPFGGVNQLLSAATEYGHDSALC
jgi:hypothetical protein